MQEQRDRIPGIKYLVRILSSSLTLASLLVLLGILKTGEQLSTRLYNLFQNPQRQPTVKTESIILNQLREASELTTAAFTMQAVVPAHQERTLYGMTVGTTKLLYIAHGQVLAGVDLNQLTPKNIQLSNDRIQIHLPPPRILNSKIDVNRSNIYDYNRGFLGLGPDVAPQLQLQAEREALKEITISACTEGLLTHANQRAKMVVTQFLSATGHKNIQVTAQPVSSETCITQTLNKSARSPHSSTY